MTEKQADFSLIWHPISRLVNITEELFKIAQDGKTFVVC